MSPERHTMLCALGMAKAGFRVFPLQPNSKKPFVHNTTPAELKALAGGINISTCDPDLIRRWFELCPTINYGVSAFGHVIVDVDVAKGKRGRETFTELGPWPETFTILTPSEGEHHYFAGPGTSQRPLGDGLDVRSIGGYVVGPGSRIDGKEYRVVNNRPVAALPEAIRGRLSERKGKAPTLPGGLPVPPPGGWNPPGSIELATAYAKGRPPAIEGQRGNDHTIETIRWFWDEGISEDKTVEILRDHWDHRNEPPWGEDWLKYKVASIYRGSEYPAGNRSLSLEFGDVKPLPEPEDSEEGDGFEFLDVSAGPSALPPRPWLVEDMLIRGALTGLVAPAGTGKSTFTLALAIGLAIGSLELLGLKLKDQRPHTVILVNNEDDRDETLRRLYAICEHHGIAYADLHHRILHHNSAKAFHPFSQDLRTKRPTPTQDFKRLAARIRKHNASLFILDPLIEMHESDENDNGSIHSVMERFRTLARATGCSGLIVHHTKKPGSAASEEYATDMNAARGGSSFTGNVRVQCNLHRMSVKDAANYGVSKQDAAKHVRLDVVKGSYSSDERKPKWYYRSSQKLATGEAAPSLRHKDLQTVEDREERKYFHKLTEFLVDGPQLIKDAAEYLVRNCENLPARTTAKEIEREIRHIFAAPIKRDRVQIAIVNEQFTLAHVEPEEG